jgi:hypothetical protein
MRVAIITAGLPRFTRDFINVLNQLKGFDTADLYINLWNTDWAKDLEEASTKISKILPDHIVLKNIALVDQPSRKLPEHTSQSSDLQWWYDRRIGQIHCLKLAMDLVDEPYDIVIRVRPDGSLNQDVDVSALDFSNTDIYFCSNMMGKSQSEPNDQFLIATQEGMKFFCDLYNNFDYWMLEACPNWENDVHEWALEHIVGKYYRDSNKQIVRGAWTHDINRVGRSVYTTDKHSHVHVAEDPTS